MTAFPQDHGEIVELIFDEHNPFIVEMSIGKSRNAVRLLAERLIEEGYREEAEQLQSQLLRVTHD